MPADVNVKEMCAEGSNGNSESGENYDLDVEGEDEIPSLKSLARNLKRTQSQEKQDNDNEDGDFGVRPAKIGCIARNAEHTVDDPDEREEKKARLANSQVELRRELLDILKQYFKAAFTIIVKKRRLCPSDGFRETKVLGVKVPTFVHPSSLEYVEEVAQKFLLFVSRNTTEGCVMHIMVEKSKTFYVVQRIVFRMFGTLDVSKCLENETDSGAYLDGLKTHCRVSLYQLVVSDLLKPVLLPHFSRWNISIGLKKEFVQMDCNAFNELWNADPSGSYFPWKERPKNLAGPGSQISKKIEAPETPSNHSNIFETSKGDVDSPVTSKWSNGYGSSEEHRSGRVQNHISSKSPKCEETNDIEASQSTVSSTNSSPEIIVATDDEDVPTLDDMGIVCFPLSTFPICEGLILSCYILQYPAPSSVPVFNRNKTTKMVVRLSHVRSRALKHFGHY